MSKNNNQNRPEDKKFIENQQVIPEEGKSGGFVGLLKKIIKNIFHAICNMPQQEQISGKENLNQQETERNTKAGKSPEDLDQNTVEQAGKNLKEGMNLSTSNNSIDGPSQSPNAKEEEKKNGKQI